jgi:hypothetical protein
MEEICHFPYGQYIIHLIADCHIVTYLYFT